MFWVSVFCERDVSCRLINGCRERDSSNNSSVRVVKVTRRNGVNLCKVSANQRQSLQTVPFGFLKCESSFCSDPHFWHLGNSDRLYIYCFSFSQLWVNFWGYCFFVSTRFLLPIPQGRFCMEPMALSGCRLKILAKKFQSKHGGETEMKSKIESGTWGFAL